MPQAKVVDLDRSEPPLDPFALLAELPDPVVVVDASTKVLWGNRAAEVWSGWQLEEWVGREAAELLHPDDLATGVVSLASVQEKELGTTVEIRLRNRTGIYSRFEIRGRSALHVDGVAGIVLSLRDVTDRRRWEVAQGRTDTLEAILDNARAITMLLDGDGTVRSASRALTNLLGHAIEDTVGRHLAELADPVDAERVRVELDAAGALRQPVSFEAMFCPAPHGAPVPLSLTVVNLLDDDAVEGLIVTAVDISQLAETRARLEHAATHDGLTDLPNRTLFLDRLEHALAVARRRESSVSLVYCDVDRFKCVNDEHGHASGDAVLVEVARRLRAMVRESDTVARLGGDEFVVLVEEDDPEPTLRRIHAAFELPFSLPDGELLEVTLSCGVMTSGGEVDAGAVLASADAAMYRAKQR